MLGWRLGSKGSQKFRGYSTKPKGVGQVSKTLTASEPTAEVVAVVATSNTATHTATKSPEVVELSPKARKALLAFSKAKAAETKAKEAKAKAEAILREALGEATKGTLDGVAVLSVVSSKNTSFDRELMKSLYPEAYEATLRETAYTYIKTI